MENYRTVYVINPAKRHYDGMLDGVTYRVPAKGFLPAVCFVAKHLMGANDKLEEYDNILDVMDRVKALGTYEVYFERRADATPAAPVVEADATEEATKE